MERTFDRIPVFDERSRQYPIRALLHREDPRSYTWRVPLWLDQGEEGECVGYSWVHELAARPVEVPDMNEAVAHHVYSEAQKIDPWPGENYEGTSVLAGAKIVQRLGYMDEYRWAFGLKDALAAVSRHGPAILGVNWYEGMFNTDSEGFLHAKGNLAGGHAIVMNGVNVKGRYVTVHNSWGPDWGRDGEARMSWDTLEYLLDQNGEVCLPVIRKK